MQWLLGWLVDDDMFKSFEIVSEGHSLSFQLLHVVFDLMFCRVTRCFIFFSNTVTFTFGLLSYFSVFLLFLLQSYGVGIYPMVDFLRVTVACSITLCSCATSC